jgi:hypothetical protein
MSDTSYNLYDKITSIDWNGQHFILTVRDEIAANSFSYAYSADGTSWTKSQFGANITTANPYTAKFLGDKYVVAGNLATSSLDACGNTIAKNCMVDIIDGQFPVAIQTNLGGNSVIYDVEQNIEHPHKIVFPKNCTLSLGSNLSYSLDQGQSWSVAVSPFSGTALDAVWNGKLFVAVGTTVGEGQGMEANTIATSLDGIHWTGRGNYIFASSCNGIDWSPPQKKYVAVGSGPNIVATSADGIYWRPTNQTLFSAGGNDVKWGSMSGSGLWVTTGNCGQGGGPTIAYSYDAVAWQYAANSFSISGQRIYYDQESAIWTIYGSDPSYNIATSSDGIHWNLSFVSGANALSLDMERGQFADNSLNLYPGIPYPLYIADLSGVNKLVHNNCDRGYAHIQPICIGCGSGANSIATSIDGIQWTAIPNSIFSSCNKAVWNGKLWTIVGTGGTHWVATSPDGYEWTGRNSVLMTECYDVAWNGAYFVAVGRYAGVASLATSQDGMIWTPVSISAVFSTRIHAIEWTGAVWLAYGSGTNTTAISSSIDASVWSATDTPNLCIVDCSNIAANNIASVSASSYQGSDIAANIVDGSFNIGATKWSSAGSNYDVCGNYIGSNTTQGVSGEWVQIQLTSSLSCSNYYIVLSIADAGAIPKSCVFMGSNDASTWNTLDIFSYGTAYPPNNDWKYPFVCLPLDISAGFVSAYSYYRIVFTSSFGADHISVAEIALFDGGAKQLDQYIRPVILKDCILHPTRILSIDLSGGGREVPNIYRISDLSCRLIRNGVIRGGTHVNNAIYGLTAEPVAAIFDGENHVVFSIRGEVAYLSNAASNTGLNFDTSMNGTSITGIGGPVYAACYNSKFILVKSSYIVFNRNDHLVPTFYSSNLSSLFTEVKGLASNSGYGFVVSPNTIYLREDERLSLVTPKFYDGALMPDTSVSFNVYNELFPE